MFKDFSLLMGSLRSDLFDRALSRCDALAQASELSSAGVSAGDESRLESAEFSVFTVL